MQIASSKMRSRTGMRVKGSERMSTSNARATKARTLSAKRLAILVGGAVTAACLAQPGLTAEPKGKEKCYGIAKAGENGCAAANGSHACGGLSRVSYSGQEW